jgi:integrase
VGRHRKELQLIPENGHFATRFVHPLSHKTVRLNLGSAISAQTGIQWLNFIFMNPEHWQNLPPEVPPHIREMWMGGLGRVRLSKKCVTRQGVRVDSDEPERLRVEIARLTSLTEALQQRVGELEARLDQRTRQLEEVLGQSVRSGPSPTLGQALKDWLDHYVGHQPAHTQNVRNVLTAFVAHFGSNTLVDRLRNREREIHSWMMGKGVSAGWRHQMRCYILRFLEESGLRLDRKALPPVKARDIDRDRGPIRWLEEAQARAMLENLKGYWQELFRVQLDLGLRPDEMITLKRQDFSSDFSELKLSPYKNLTLKNGTRAIKVPEVIRDLIRRRLEQHEFVFPDPKKGNVWKNAEAYNARYRRQLVKAGEAAKIPFRLDCRTARRTCASRLLRAGRTEAEVAALLGDRVESVRKHYARILSREVDPSVVAL